MWKPNITKQGNEFYALVTKENNGETIVSRSFNGKYYKTEKAALRSANKHIEKFKMNEGE